MFHICLLFTSHFWIETSTPGARSLKVQKINKTHKSQEAPEAYKITRLLPKLIQLWEETLTNYTACKFCREFQGVAFVSLPSSMLGRTFWGYSSLWVIYAAKRNFSTLTSVSDPNTVTGSLWQVCIELLVWSMVPVLSVFVHLSPEVIQPTLGNMSVVTH